MKAITVTEKNIKSINGRLKRFFKHGDFMVWHNFDCGMKKHISRYIDINIPGHYEKHVDTMYPYRGITVHERVYSDKITTLYIEMNYDEGFRIKPGMKVAFLGNRVIIRSDFLSSIHKYCYQCFQIL